MIAEPEDVPMGEAQKMAIQMSCGDIFLAIATEGYDTDISMPGPCGITATRLMGAPSADLRKTALKGVLEGRADIHAHLHVPQRTNNCRTVKVKDMSPFGSASPPASVPAPTRRGGQTC